ETPPVMKGYDPSTRRQTVSPSGIPIRPERDDPVQRFVGVRAPVREGTAGFRHCPVVAGVKRNTRGHQPQLDIPWVSKVFKETSGFRQEVSGNEDVDGKGEIGPGEGLQPVSAEAGKRLPEVERP